MFNNDYISSKERMARLEIKKKSKWRRLNLKSDNKHKKSNGNKNLKNPSGIQWKLKEPLKVKT